GCLGRLAECRFGGEQDASHLLGDGMKLLTEIDIGLALRIIGIEAQRRPAGDDVVGPLLEALPSLGMAWTRAGRRKLDLSGRWTRPVLLVFAIEVTECPHHVVKLLASITQHVARRATGGPVVERRGPDATLEQIDRHCSHAADGRDPPTP